LKQQLVCREVRQDCTLQLQDLLRHPAYMPQVLCSVEAAADRCQGEVRRGCSEALGAMPYCAVLFDMSLHCHLGGKCG
jgi:hypothetical protein